MILPAIFLVFATACTPDGIDREQPESTSCESGFILDGSACVPESCGTGRWGSLPVDDDTVYVDRAAEEGGDGTEAEPYTTIQRGVNRAGATGGGLVAVAAGTYPETLSFTTDHADVHLAGRCREMVILDASVGDEETPGIGIDAGYGAVEVSGVTMNGSSREGLVVASGEVVVRDLAISGSAYFGVVAYLPALSGLTDLVMEDCLINGNTTCGVYATDPGTQVTLRDTTVRNTWTDANGEHGWGIEVLNDATLSAEGCLIDGNTGVGLIAFDSGAEVTLQDTTVKDTRPDANGEGGWGIQVNDGATLYAEGGLIDGNTDCGLFAADPGTMVTIRDSTISGTKPGTDLMSSAASGVTVQEGAFLFASHLVVAANQGPGLMVNADGVLECVGCTIQDSQFAGAVALAGGTLIITDSTIEDTTPNVNLLGGAGVYTWTWLGDPPTVTVTNTLIQDNPVAGVWLIGNGTYMLTGNTISGGTGEPFGSGSRCGDAILARDGVTVWDGTSGLFLEDNVFQNAEGSGVFLDGSSALMSGNTYSGNAMDLVVQNQSCDPIPGYYSEAPRQNLCPTYSYPTCYAEFFYVAIPSDPVDWEEEKAAPRPQFLPMAPFASLARPIYGIIPTRTDHPSYLPSLPR